MFGSLDISTSALVAQRVNLDTIAGNVAGMHPPRDANGNPTRYRRRVALVAPGNPAAGPGAPGVHVAAVVDDPSPFPLVHDPGHPDAIKTGPDSRAEVIGPLVVPAPAVALRPLSRRDYVLPSGVPYLEVRGADRNRRR